MKITKNQLEGFESCDNTEETEPILVSKQRICGNPFAYRTYIDYSVYSSIQSDYTDAQVVQFINELYRYQEPDNLDIYFKQTIPAKDIFMKVCEFISIFERRTASYFATWCRNKRLLFLNGAEVRDNGIRCRELYTMEDSYFGKPEKHS
ncbi:hypothetical protein INT48_009368 [Thamnidium elegans]|uniref:Uncharacterized protein n=1 Tax=Thamnidium elegans TaxID=101142 RepID=A0A8H7SSK6_9FUNG|nr:hypothetical protein INT48_009368 [Thamnidium elegans]